MAKTKGKSSGLPVSGIFFSNFNYVFKITFIHSVHNHLWNINYHQTPVSEFWSQFWYLPASMILLVKLLVAV